MNTRTNGWMSFGRLMALTLSFSLIMALGCKKKETDAKDDDGKKDKKEQADKPGKTTEKKAADSPEKEKADSKKKGDDTKKADAPAVTPGGSKGVNVAIGLNIEKLRQTFLWKMIAENPKIKEALNNDGYKVFTEVCKVDPMKDISSVVFGMGGDGDDKKFGVFIKGKFDTEKLMACGKGAMEQAKKPVSETKVGGKSALMFKSDKDKKEEVFIIAVAKDTMGVASKGLENVVATGQSSFGNASLAAMVKSVEKPALLWGGMGKIKIPAGGGGKMDALLGKMGDLKGGNFTVKTASGKWDLNVMVDAGTKEAAKKLEQLINFAKMGLAMQAAKGGSDGPPEALVEALKKLKSSTDDSKITLSISLPEAMLKKMADKGVMSLN